MGCSGSKEASKPAAVQASRWEPDPQLLRRSMLRMEAALSVAEALFRATAGKEFYDVYARPTLVSYGASCKVLTAWHKETQKKVSMG